MKFVILTSAIVSTIMASEEPPVPAAASVESYYECGDPELIVDST